MRIAFITTMAGSPWGGSEELWFKLAKEASNEGHQVDCSVFRWKHKPDEIHRLSILGISVKRRIRFIYKRPYAKIWGKLIERTIAEFQLKRHLENKDFALISMGGFCDLAVDVFRRPLLETRTRFSVIIHVNREDFYIQAEKLLEVNDVCRKAEKVYFVSSRLKEIAIRQTGYAFPNGELIINPVSLDCTGPLTYPKGETLQLACVGRLDAKVKGQALLLQCLSTQDWRSRNWHLNIYGKGDDLYFFQTLASHFGIAHKVSFHGFVKDVKLEIWEKCNLLIMPSYYEGLPIVLIEAMLCGRAAIVTDVGGNSELIKDCETGFISSATNKKSLLDTVQRAWTHKNRWEQMGKDAYTDAYYHFHESSHARNLIDILPK